MSKIIVTFYRFPTVPLLTTWYEKSAANFRIAVKVPRLITHYKKFIDTDRLMDDFYLSFCGMSHPDLPKDIVKNTSLFYFRLHGEEQLYASRYSDKQLHVLQMK